MKTVHAFGITVLALSLSFAMCERTARAQTIGELGIGGSMIGAGAVFATQSKSNIDVEAVRNRLRMYGFVDVTEDPQNKNQYWAKDPNGGRVLITMDPTTGGIISAVPQ